MPWKPPLPEGITPVDRANRIVLYCDDTLRMARSLKEMTVDWHFFTIGCIYTYGGLDVNVIAEYTQTHEDPDCGVMTITANRPIFVGIRTPGHPDRERLFDNELWATPLEYWPGLRERLVEISMVDRKKGRFARTTVQELEIVDHVAVDNAIVAGAKPPTLTITAFGIDGTQHHAVFTPQIDGPYAKARVVKLPIRDETRQIGKAILAHVPNPFPLPELRIADQAEVARKIQEAEEKNSEH